MNLFARGLGGYCSDKLNAKMGMKGRLLTQLVLLILEAIMIFIFSRSVSLAASIVTMVFFSAFVQACEGSTYGIVPYVDPPATGSISGIVGAGGNMGAVCFGLEFRQLLIYIQAFNIMAGTILGSAILTGFIIIKGHSSLLSSEPAKSSAPTTLNIPDIEQEESPETPNVTESAEK